MTESYIKNMLIGSTCQTNPVSTPAVQGPSLLKPEADTNASYPYRKAVESLNIPDDRY